MFAKLSAVLYLLLIPHVLTAPSPKPILSTLRTTEPLSPRTLPRTIIPFENLSPRDEMTGKNDKLKQPSFYECPYSNPSPNPNHCAQIISSLQDPNLTLRLTKGSCLALDSQTCTAFFCLPCADKSPVQSIDVTAQFMASQLDSASVLCVSGGNAASLGSVDRPQWFAGFVYAGDPLPDLNLC